MEQFDGDQHERRSQKADPPQNLLHPAIRGRIRGTLSIDSGHPLSSAMGPKRWHFAAIPTRM
jgi:hypothetical protein